MKFLNNTYPGRTSTTKGRANKRYTVNDEILMYLSTIEVEDHFHRLLESERELLGILSKRFSVEPDFLRRQALVRLAWRRGEPGTSKFLGIALDDGSPLVWKEALDGLVSAGDSDAIAILELGRSSSQEDKRPWMDEAINEM